MTTAVVDTDVVSYIFKNHPFGSRYDADLAGHIVLISFMTVAEIERWVLQYRWGKQRIASYVPPKVHRGAVQSGPLPQVG